jgi:hypothetical protein
MKKKTANEQSEAANSGPNDSEKTSDYVRFENAVRAILHQDPKEAARIRKMKVPKDPEAKKPKGS